jgi:outer membrane protein assembly factor BamD (BamD/ComL family)
MYHYITIEVVMRDCKSAEDAKEKCSQLMPQYPDENSKYMESWEITSSRSPFAVTPCPTKT